MHAIPNVAAMVRALTAATLVTVAIPAYAADINDADRLGEVVVTAARMQSPLVIETDPRKPRQPLPAHDGADYLKTVPGFSSIRKGGTDGDPVFRGMAASRVSMLVDGELILGGCGIRMDPPTAYVFPEAFDRIVIIKGPQSVLHGPGNSAATVLFESQPPTFPNGPWRAYGSALAASAGRSDFVADVAAGTGELYARVNGTRAAAEDYEDGAGNVVHSGYLRWSSNATIGWHPDEATRVELTGARSDGEAAYADRAMDGAKFARDNVGLKFERTFSGDVLKGVELQAYYNYVDHVMDNYSLRPFVPSMVMPGRSASNPDRRTTGARFAADVKGPVGITATVGLDYQDNQHRNRSTMNATMMPYENMARTEDAQFRDTGLFGEAVVLAGAGQRVVTGLRADRWRAHDARTAISLGMMSAMPNPTANERRSTTLVSGFSRYERDLGGAGTTLYAGLGYVERFPDYWELISNSRESAGSLSAFATRPERTTQLDFGAVHRADKLELSLSAFASRVDDFILIEANYPKGMRLTNVARNIDARTFGAEADLAYALTAGLTLTGTAAYTYGENRSDNRPLAQIAPLELRAGLEYSTGRWHGGVLARLVGAQDRVAVNQGNVVGQDIGATGGFAVLSVNAAWQPRVGLLVSAGIDNLFDRLYAEHLSRGGAMLSGYTQTTRVNEPGRTLWLKLSADLR